MFGISKFLRNSSLQSALKTSCRMRNYHSTKLSYNRHESFLNGSNSVYVDEMYKSWRLDPSTVHKSWDVYFTNVENGNMENAFAAPPQLTGGQVPVGGAPSGNISSKTISEYVSLLALIRAYQVRGHNLADLDPLGIGQADLSEEQPRELDYKNYGFTEADLNKEFNLDTFSATGMTSFIAFGDKKVITLGELIQKLKDIYCKNIGFEFMHINDKTKCDWIRDQIERPGFIDMTKEEKLITMRRLNQAEGFERFLAAKHGTEKRFGIEGLEAMVCGVKAMIDEGSELGVESLVFGMPHRGRLNVLGNVMKKPLESIFSEFQSNLAPSEEGSGDVKYHLGSSHDRAARNGKMVHLSLVANPSHLEAVNPVVLGKTRAEQFYRGDNTRKKVVPVLLHGDASFSGQGVVFECLNMSDLPHYTTGGTIHVVCNNQVGFTTDPRFSRSSPYCTDVAKTLQTPIFHVNADDPEAVVKVSELAMKYRNQFGTDVVLDLIGYRRYGHNEGDNPAFTQPRMYQAIAKHPRVETKYKEKLLAEGAMTTTEYEQIDSSYQTLCTTAFEKSKDEDFTIDDWLDSRWKGILAPKDTASVYNTGVSADILKHIGSVISSAPEGFNLHPGVKRILKARFSTTDSGKDIDWATAEALAFGSLLNEQYHVRLSGQDVQRGTFTQRHHVLHDQKNENTHTPLNALSENQAEYNAINSSLSEYGILGFELGFSYANPNALILWEAQFGDFVNGAQIIIDQFLSSGEQKWLRQTGLVLLLPHAYEGMGPEHSSARMERFLQQCDDDSDVFPDTTIPIRRQIQESNWQILNCSTPANYFHALRRQVHRDFRKPAIMFTPKSLLRNRMCTSTLEDMGPESRFRRLINEENIPSGEGVRKILFCSGKVRYTLIKAREEAGLQNEIAIAAVEQIAPFPFDLVKRQVECYPNAEIVWCQEEPKNMGAWSYVMPRIETALNKSSTHSQKRPSYVGRPAAAATATGLKYQHYKEEADFVEKALA